MTKSAVRPAFGVACDSLPTAITRSTRSTRGRYANGGSSDQPSAHDLDGGDPGLARRADLPVFQALSSLSIPEPLVRREGRAEAWGGSKPETKRSYDDAIHGHCEGH